MYIGWDTDSTLVTMSQSIVRINSVVSESKIILWIHLRKMHEFRRPWELIKQLSYSHMNHQGAVSIRKTVLPGMAIPMLKIRRPNGRLIFNMEIAILR